MDVTGCIKCAFQEELKNTLAAGVGGGGETPTQLVFLLYHQVSLNSIKTDLTCMVGSFIHCQVYCILLP